MELFKILGRIAVDNDDANTSLDKTGKKGEEAQGKLSNAFAAIGKGAIAVGKKMAVGLAAGTAALVAIAESTREYRTEMGKLETAFTTSGHSTESAINTYKALQGVLGETDQAVEAANHLAKLTNNEEDLATWTNICTGVYATFGASLPIEGLTEAANETAKVGQVTGPLADALNWAGVSEEKFNERLANCSSEQQRQALIMNTLNGLYEDAAIVFNETNAEVIRANQANEAWASSMATIGGAIEPILTDVKTLGANLLSNLTPGIQSVAAAFRGLLNGDTDAASRIGESVSNIFDTLLAKLNGVLPQAIEIATSLFSNLSTVLLPAILTAAKSLMAQLPTITRSFMQIFEQVLYSLSYSLPDMMTTLVDTLFGVLTNLTAYIPDVVMALTEVVSVVAQSLPDIVSSIVAWMPELIQTIVDALVICAPELINAATMLVLAIVPALPQIIQVLVDVLPDLITQIINALIALAPQLIQGAIQLVVALAAALPEIMQSLWDGIVGIFTSIWEAIKGVFAPVGEWFSNMWASLGEVPGLSSLKTMIENIWNAIVAYITVVGTSIWNIISTYWNAVKNNISTVVTSIWNVIKSIWNAIKTTIQSVMQIITSILKGDWEGVKNAISNIVNAIWNVITSIWNGIKNTISAVMSGIWNTLMSVWQGIVNTVTSYVNTILSVVSSVFNGVWDTISSVFSGIWATAVSAWNEIKTAIQNPIESAKNIVKNAIDKIKGFFNFKISWPKIPMPHFSVSPSGWKIGDLLKGSIPRLGIEWYAKGGIMEDPTAFGINPNNGKVMVGGEAGAEAIAPISTLQGYVSAAVAGQNAVMVSILEQILEAILALDDNMGGNLREALLGTRFSINDREFARLVKAVG